MTRRGWALFATMCVVWGIPYLLIRVAVRQLTPATLVFARTGIGTLLLVPVALRTGQLQPVLRRWRPLVAYTVVELAIPWFLLSSAERHLSSSLSGLLVAAVPLVGTALAAASGERHQLHASNLAGVLVGLAGVAALVGFDVGAADLRWVAALAVVAVGYALGPRLLAGPLADLPGLGVVAASLGLCAIGYAPAAALQAPGSFPSGRVIASVAVLGVVCTAGAFIVFFHLIAAVGPVKATIITYVNPAVAVTLGVIFLGESFTAATAAGFALILAGSVLATGRARGRSPVPAAPSTAGPIPAVPEP